MLLNVAFIIAGGSYIIEDFSSLKSIEALFFYTLDVFEQNYKDVAEKTLPVL